MLNNSLSHASKIGRNKKVLKVGKTGVKYDILIVQEKQLARIVNNKKITLEMNTWKREVEARWLKEFSMRMKT